MQSERLTWEQAIEWFKAQPDKQELVRAGYYDEPLIGAAQRFIESQEWEAICKLLRAWIPGRVLELGAGHGIGSYAFARAGCAVVATELDPSPIVGANAIQCLAKETNLSIQVVRSAGEKQAFYASYFDIVYAREVLHHARDLKELCQEAARVLRPGGVFLATREHVISRSKDLPTFLQSHSLHHLYGGENAFLLCEYMSALQSAGLAIMHVYGPYDSPINAMPMTRTQNRARIAAKLQKYVGRTAANRLSKEENLWFLMGHIRSWINNTPGRLYSFLSVKSA